MPRLHEVAKALVPFRDRYQFIDAFADDIDELRSRSIGDVARLVRMAPHPLFVGRFDDEVFSVEVFENQGIARVRLGAPQAQGEQGLNATAVGGVLGVALAAASGKKEGLLGGLVLGMLVGGIVGAAAAERALALQFDLSTNEWRLYNGPLLRWAKRAMIPAPAA